MSILDNINLKQLAGAAASAAIAPAVAAGPSDATKLHLSHLSPPD